MKVLYKIKVIIKGQKVTFEIAKEDESPKIQDPKLDGLIELFEGMKR